MEQVTALITEAGGTVSGTISLQPEYSDPSTASSLQNYVTGPGMPPGASSCPRPTTPVSWSATCSPRC